MMIMSQNGGHMPQFGPIDQPRLVNVDEVNQFPGVIFARAACTQEIVVSMKL